MKTRATTLLVLVALVALIVSSAVHAGIPRKHSLVVPVGPAPHLYPHAKPFKEMSLSELEKHQQAALAHYRYVSRFFLRWRSKNAQARDLYGLTIKTCRATGILEPANYCWYAAAARWTAKELAETKKKIRAQRPASPSWLVAAFECIHSHEGAWNANTGNSYYGGLQFGWSEWQRFGGRYAARADLATPAQQIAAGIAYYEVSGFSPWPNTARACGLL